MFYCEECRDKNNWPGIVPFSYGPCEVCGFTKSCYDIPSKYLPVLPKPKSIMIQKNQLLDAQADLQTVLGWTRLKLQDKNAVSLKEIEDRLTRSLARLHKILGDAGHPMYKPATHPDVK